MEENQEIKNNDSSKRYVKSMLLTLLKYCPHIVKQDIGIQAFVDDLSKAMDRMQNISPNEAGFTKDLLSFLKLCPQAAKSGTGVENFIEELKAISLKYSHFFDGL